ncbi:MAG: hypothetical protein QOF37_1501 [Thermoleophilaceae bacterium]|nr:hypothetical protein [Thermoleophilaceae bacterium]
MPETARLNILDELYLHLDRDDEPWSVQLEVEVEGTLDGERLAAAVKAAAARHPVARARLADSRGTDVRYQWDVADELAEVPLEIVDCTDEEDLEIERRRAYGAVPPLDGPAPFTLTLAHRSGGDSLMLNLHHAAGDGIGALRLMGSILRAYAGEDDPMPDVDQVEARDIGKIVSSSLGDRLSRGRALAEHVARFATPPARIAEAGGSPDAPPYGFELIELDAPAAQAALSLRAGGATANDVLLGVLGVAVRRWNEQHDGDERRIALMMPVNLRPEEWRFDVLANFASYVTVHLAEDEQHDLETAIAATADRTRRIKEDGIAGLIVDLLQIPTALPTGVKQRLQDLIPLTGDLVVDTAVLSNLGRLQDVPHLGSDGGAVRSVWFSPPGRMPLGLSVGVATLGEKMFVTLRYRRALFDETAAAEFGHLYRDLLTGAGVAKQATG